MLAGLSPVDGAPALAENIPNASEAAPVGKAALVAAGALLDQLKLARDEVEAEKLVAKIWAAWRQSGDPAIDDMMAQADVLMQSGRAADALALLDDVVSKAPDFAEGWNKRATLLYVMRQFDRSMADIRKVLILEPRHFGAIAGVGLIALAKGDRARALSAYEKVLEIDPLDTGARRMVDALSEAL
jgi:tetratricopeptide (TPR) repeat protein